MDLEQEAMIESDPQNLHLCYVFGKQDFLIDAVHTNFQDSDFHKTFYALRSPQFHTTNLEMAGAPNCRDGATARECRMEDGKIMEIFRQTLSISQLRSSFYCTADILLPNFGETAPRSSLESLDDLPP